MWTSLQHRHQPVVLHDTLTSLYYNPGIMATAASIRSTSTPVDTPALKSQVRAHVDDNFADLEALTGHAGPSTPRKGKRRRGLTEEIAYWEERAGRAEKEVSVSWCWSTGNPC